MEIMNTLGSPLRRVSLSAASLLVATCTGFGADLLLHKVPSSSPSVPDAVSVAFVNYNANAGPQADPRALYVSSGAELKQAANIGYGQPATSFNFAAGDQFPTAMIDLGKAKNINRVSTLFAAQKGTMA